MKIENQASKKVPGGSNKKTVRIKDSKSASQTRPQAGKKQSGIGVDGSIKILPDAVTANMASLKRIKLLDPARASSQENRLDNLTDEFKKRKANLDKHL